MVTIKAVRAWQSYDSLGFPTLSGTMELSDGFIVKTSVGNNLHKGDYAALYLYDNEDMFEGKGVARAVSYINDLLGPKLVGVDPSKSVDIDVWLLKADNSEKKETLGANTTLLISQLAYKAGAHVNGKQLFEFINDQLSAYFGLTPVNKMPSPIIPLITGGTHGSKTLNFQEFSVVAATSKKYEQALYDAQLAYHELQKVLQYRGIFSGLGSDGAYIPSLATNGDAFEVIRETLLKCGLKIGTDIYFAMDFAADFFYKGKYYISDSPAPLNTDHMLERIISLEEEYKTLIIEDPFATKDENGWKALMEKEGRKVFVVGDDLVQSNIKRVEHAVSLCNCVGVKLTQRGTVYEGMQLVSKARDNNLKVLVSQSAAETNDTFIADFSLAVQADFVKFGSVTRGERVAKHNRMIELSALTKHA